MTKPRPIFPSPMIRDNRPATLRDQIAEYRRLRHTGISRREATRWARGLVSVPNDRSKRDTIELDAA